MNKAPAFEFELLSDEMSNQAIGCYIKLLRHCHEQDSIPKDIEEIAKICGEPPDEMAKLWPSLAGHFHNGFIRNRLYHFAVEDHWKQRKLFHTNRAEAGKIGAIKRWGEKEEDDPCPHQDIIDLYHEILPMCARIRIWPGHLKARLRARWREDEKRQNLEWWREYFLFIAESAFLIGEETRWKADLEWIIGPRNMTKIFNGRYHENKFSGLDEWLEIRRRKREGGERREEIPSGHESSERGIRQGKQGLPGENGNLFPGPCRSYD